MSDLSDAPLCEAFDPAPRAPASPLPAGAVDAHFHVFGPDEIYPFVPGRSYTAPPAPLEAYEQLARRIGFTRAVAVQPSIYGTDNRRTLAILRETTMPMRAVIAMDQPAPDSELARLHEVGVRGIRINLVFRGGGNIGNARALADRIRDLGWHLQFLADVSQMEGLASRMEALRIPVVFDHFGHVPAGKGIAEPGFRELLALMRAGIAWVKLSAPYRITTRRSTPYVDVRAFAEALIEANPDRVLWATDWPHPAIPVPMPNDGDLAEMALSWSPDPEIRRKLFVTNAERLYGFEAARP